MTTTALPAMTITPYVHARATALAYHLSLQWHYVHLSSIATAVSMSEGTARRTLNLMRDMGLVDYDGTYRATVSYEAAVAVLHERLLP